MLMSGTRNPDSETQPWLRKSRSAAGAPERVAHLDRPRARGDHDERDRAGGGRLCRTRADEGAHLDSAERAHRAGDALDARRGLGAAHARVGRRERTGALARDGQAYDEVPGGVAPPARVVLAAERDRAAVAEVGGAERLGLAERPGVDVDRQDPAQRARAIGARLSVDDEAERAAVGAAGEARAA